MTTEISTPDLRDLIPAESEFVPEYPGFQTLVDDIVIARGVDEDTARNWIVFAADAISEDF